MGTLYADRVRGLDSIRGFAALAVCFYHWETIGFHPKQSDEWFRFGLLGVEVFFMISGYLILSTVARSKSIPHFMNSRIFRLYPVYIISILPSAAYVFLVHKFDQKTVLVNLTMFQSFLGYENIINPYWTLAFEINFYVLVALVVFCNRELINIFCCIWLLVSLIYHMYFPEFLAFDKSQELVRLSYIILCPQFSPFFVCGIALYRLEQGKLSFYNIFLLVFGLSITMFGRSDFAIISGPMYFFLTCLVLLLMKLVSTKKLVLERLWLDRIGKISYPLYLIHCSFAHLCALTTVHFGYSDGVGVILSAPLSIVGAVVLHKYVEQPAQHAGRIISRFLDDSYYLNADKFGSLGQKPDGESKFGEAV